MSELGPIRIDHIGIAATSLDAGSAFWQLLGLDNSGPDLENFDQGVKIRFLDLTLSPSFYDCRAQEASW